MSDTAIRVENLGKQYHIGRQQARYKTIRETLVDGAKAPFRRAGRVVRGHGSAADLDETIWALKDVSFEVKQGEVVGVIGRNGAGKTTLLKLLSRITEPTAGDAWIHGRVGSLLEVGTGFHPELTGRENVYLNGAILGMRRNEMDSKFDEIVDFAEIEKFIDTPVKHYSSGMYVRLAFSVAAHMDTEILLVDEVLAVGDAEFQKKCLGKMGDVAKGGRTVIFVSHDMSAVRTLCTRTILLDDGYKKIDGPSTHVIGTYLEESYDRSSVWRSSETDRSGDVFLKSVQVKDSNGLMRSEFTNTETIILEMEIYIGKLIKGLKVGYDLEVDWGTVIFSSFHNDIKDLIDVDAFEPGNYIFSTQIPPRLLGAKTYFISPSAGIHRHYWIFREKRLVSFSISFQVDNINFKVRKRPGYISPLYEWAVNREEESITN